MRDELMCEHWDMLDDGQMVCEKDGHPWKNITCKDCMKCPHNTVLHPKGGK